MVNIGKIYSELTPIGKVLFVLAMLGIFFATMDRLVLGPILSQMKILDAEIDAKTETVRRNLRILSFEDRIMQEYAQHSEYLDSGSKSQEEIIGALLKKIELFAKQQSISILNIRPGDVVENPVFHEYHTGLECEGPLPALLEFMKALEESDYLFQITKYTMTPKSKTGEIIRCDMSITRFLIAGEVLTNQKLKEI